MAHSVNQIFGGYCSFTFEGDPTAVRGFITHEEDPGTRLLFPALPAQATPSCCGDCNGNGAVAINELITAVNNALGVCSN